MYCQMTTLPGCESGGWTMVMKMDGTQVVYKGFTNLSELNLSITIVNKRFLKTISFTNWRVATSCVLGLLRNYLHYLKLNYLKFEMVFLEQRQLTNYVELKIGYSIKSSVKWTLQHSMCNCRKEMVYN